MFTGIIEELGSIRKINKKGKTLTLDIQAQKIMSDVKLGDSIAVNGVCLTVTKYDANGFEADVMPETFQDTSLSILKEGSIVNLERAMSANGRFGGHFVSGHVDCTGVIRKRTRKENAILITIDIPESYSHLVLEKGSICIDGTSLTVFHCDHHSIMISIIPHTAAETVIGYKREGEIVNLEFDMMAKYLYSFMEKKQTQKQSSSITAEFLKDNGFY